jgi:hypothetical protein
LQKESDVRYQGLLSTRWTVRALVLFSGCAAILWVLNPTTQPSYAREDKKEEQAAPFRAEEFSTGFADIWNKKDMKLAESSLSKLYNEFGTSREEALTRMKEMFDQFDSFECRHAAVEFKRFPGTNLASIKAVLDLRGKAKGEADMKPLFQTKGYASLSFEDGAWKLYGTNLYFCPKLPRFNFDTEVRAFKDDAKKAAANWGRWGVPQNEP